MCSFSQSFPNNEAKKAERGWLVGPRHFALLMQLLKICVDYCLIWQDRRLTPILPNFRVFVQDSGQFINFPVSASVDCDTVWQLGFVSLLLLGIIQSRMDQWCSCNLWFIGLEVLA